MLNAQSDVGHFVLEQDVVYNLLSRSRIYFLVSIDLSVKT